LGNIASLIDSELVLLGFRFGERALISIVHYIFLIFFVIIQMHYSIKYFGYKIKWLAFASVPVLLTSAAPFMTGSYGRPNKIIMAIFIQLLVWVIIGIFRNNKVYSTKMYILPFILMIAMGLTDEIGIAANFIAFTVAFAGLYTFRNIKMLGLVLYTMLANILILIYRYLIGPFIVYHVTGLKPTIWDALIGNTTKSNIIYGSVVTFFKYIGFLFGNIGEIGGILLFLVIFILLIYSSAKGNTKTGNLERFFVPLIFLIVCLGSIACIIFMTARIEGIIEKPALIHTYPQPFDGLMISAICFMACNLASQVPKTKIFLTLLFIIMALLNSLSLPIHVKFIKESMDKYSYKANSIIDPILSDVKFNPKNTQLSPKAIYAVSIIRSRLGKE
jgi:hypothetical protein